MERSITTEEIQMLAEVERQMDAGKVPFVVWVGGRMTVQKIVMEELGLESGRTVSHEIAGAIPFEQLDSAGVGDKQVELTVDVEITGLDVEVAEAVRGFYGREEARAILIAAHPAASVGDDHCAVVLRK